MTGVTTVAIANLKPGTSKTTCAVFLCAALHEMGLNPLLVDADRGASARRWADVAGGFPWTVVGMDVRTIYQQLTGMARHAQYGAIVVDCPQLEDHAAISKPALRFADVWLIPSAPAGIELDRTTYVRDVLDEVDSIRDVPGRRLALLTRCNRRKRTKTGPDQTQAEILTEQGYTVLDEQVHHSDTLYRQSFGTVPVLDGTPFLAIAGKLVAA